MAMPTYQAFMLPLLSLLAEGRASIKACLPDLQRHFALSNEEAAELLPSGQMSVLASRAHWARTYMGKAGLLASPRRGRHEVTPRGLALLAERPELIDNAVLERFEEFTDWKAASRAAAPAGAPASPVSSPTTSATQPIIPEDTPQDRLRTAHAELDAALADELLDALRQTTPARFERLVVDLLIAMGYGKGDPTRARAIGKSGDGGIDGIVNEDALGLDAVYVQAKRYADGNTVGRPAVQGFVGSMTGESATKGVFVTTSAFSAGALEYVRFVQQRVVLIDGARLARLMIAHGVGVRVEEVFTTRSLDAQVFDEI
jgi:restriction system protein